MKKIISLEKPLASLKSIYLNLDSFPMCHTYITPSHQFKRLLVKLKKEIPAHESLFFHDFLDTLKTSDLQFKLNQIKRYIKNLRINKSQKKNLIQLCMDWKNQHQTTFLLKKTCYTIYYAYPPNSLYPIFE